MRFFAPIILLAAILFPSKTSAIAAAPDSEKCLIRHKSHEAAVAACTPVIAALAPGDPLIKALDQRAYSYYSLGKIDLALSDYDKLVTLTEKFPTLRPSGLLTRGMIRLKSGKLDEAAIDLAEVKTLKPQWALPVFALGYLKQLKGDTAGAKADFAAAKAIEYMVDVHAAGDWGLSAGTYEERLAECTKPAFLANEILLNATCTSIIEEARETGEKLATIYLTRAGSRRREAAFPDYDESIKLFPGNPYAFSGRAAAYADIGLLDKALKDYDQSITLYDKAGFIFDSRGKIYAQKGDYEKALLDFDRAITLSPADANVYINRGKAYAAKGRYDAAIQDYEKAAKEFGSIENPHTGRGCAYYLMGDYAKAQAAFDEAIKMEENDIFAWYGRGLNKLKLGDAAGAKEDMDFAKSRNNNVAKLMAAEWGLPPKPKAAKAK